MLSKRAFYGGGCSESMQIRFLEKQPTDSAARYLLPTLTNVIRAQYDEEWLIDRVHNHLWLMSEDDRTSDTCACGLYAANDRFRTDWRNLNDDDQKESLTRESSPKYLDSFQMKSNTLKIAIETAINLQLTSVCF